MIRRPGRALARTYRPLDHDARSGGAPDSGEKGIPHTAGAARTHRGVQETAVSTEIMEWSCHRRRRLAVELRASRWCAVEVPNKAAKLTTSTSTALRAVARDEDEG